MASLGTFRESLRGEVEACSPDLTPEALRVRRPQWIVVDNHSLALVRNGEFVPSTARSYLDALLQERLGYRIVQTFGPPHAYSPVFSFPPTAQQILYLLQRSDTDAQEPGPGRPGG